MNSQTASAIETRLSEMRKNGSRRFRAKISMIAHKHDAMGPMFITDAMVREATKAAQDNVLEMLGDAITQVSAASATLDAFGLLRVALLNHLSDLATLVERWNGVPLSATSARLVDVRFAAIRQDLMANVDAHQHQFKNLGGRPSEWDWEGAKAHIKGRFPHGFTKKHGLQAEVAEVMDAWFQERDNETPSRSQTLKHVRELIQEHQRSDKIR